MSKTHPFLIAITVLNAAFALVSISQAQGTSAAPDVVRARMLEIVDSQGRVRASIQVHPASDTQQESVVLRLINADGKPGVKLASSDHTAGLALVTGQWNYLQVFPNGLKVTQNGRERASWPSWPAMDPGRP